MATRCRGAFQKYFAGNEKLWNQELLWKILNLTIFKELPSKKQSSHKRLERFRKDFLGVLLEKIIHG